MNMRRTLANVSHSFVFASLSASLLACGSASSPTAVTTTVTTTTTSVYPAAYKAAAWQANTTVAFPSACSMSYTATGVPVVHDSFYLAPVTGSQTVVATTPVSHLALGLIAYPAASLKGATATLNICPTAAASTMPTSMGAIGFMISGVALFNSYEATGTVAMADNVSYTFTQSGTTYTASFIDTCASHAAAQGTVSTWHYHAVPPCVTSLVDTATGPSHLIGFALDGYPIYGGRDNSGAIIPLAQLDACNGITSVTPEFSAATYHYVLPIGVTTAQSSISCFHGTVNAQVAALAKKLACQMPGMSSAGMILPPTKDDHNANRRL